MRKLQYLPIFVGLGILSCFLLSCKEKKVPTLDKEAHELYNRSLSLVTSYTDSILNSQDSATLIQLDKRFESTLTKLNYEYPAGTDYEITEGENDTLTMLSVRYVHAKDSMLKVFGRAATSVDSISIDSIGINPNLTLD